MPKNGLCHAEYNSSYIHTWQVCKCYDDSNDVTATQYTSIIIVINKSLHDQDTNTTD